MSKSEEALDKEESSRYMRKVDIVPLLEEMTTFKSELAELKKILSESASGGDESPSESPERRDSRKSTLKVKTDGEIEEGATKLLEDLLNQWR